MERRTIYPLGWALGWLALFALTAVTRPLLPIDETRYAAVAWEMWLRDSLLVPYLNGEPYSHKPPLLFWLIQAGWALFGVHEWVARAAPGLFALGSLFLTRQLARMLWPGEQRLAHLASFVLFTSLYWTVFSSALMFDMLMAFFTALGLVGTVYAWRRGGWRGWAVLGLAIGLGILAKGPVILLYALPVPVLAPWWANTPPARSWATWYGRLLAAVGIGAAFALLWAIPAALAGGEQYRNAILWGQTAGRMVESFAHRQPWWWYLPLLPLLLFPWLLWPPLWRALRRERLEAETRFCVAAFLPGLIAFSMISGKQAHYLLPLFPPFALLTARVLARTAPASHPADPWPIGVALAGAGVFLALIPWLAHWFALPAWAGLVSPWWGMICLASGLLLSWHLKKSRSPVEAMALASVAFVALVHIGVLRHASDYYDTRPMAERLGRLQRAGVAVANVGKYYGEFHFTGRLERPLTVIPENEAAKWAREHPRGYLVADHYGFTPEQRRLAAFVAPYRGHTRALWSAAVVRNHPELLASARAAEL